MSVLLSLTPIVLLSCALVLLIGWLVGTNIYTWGRPVSLGEDALDYVSRRTGVNNITLVMTLDGEMDPSILAQVLRRMQFKYALFRTYIVRGRRTATLKVLSPWPDLVPISVRLLSDEDWRQAFHAEINTPFCSANGSDIYPLVRTCIISSPRNADAACVLLVSVDHRLADGFSAGVIFDEMMREYSAIACGDKTDLHTLPQVALDPPTEELGPAWLMLPALFLKLLALALYIIVFVVRFRGFRRLPLRMSSACTGQSPEAPRAIAVTAESVSFAIHAEQQAETLISTPRPPTVVKGLSSLSGLFIHREPSVIGTLRVPWTTAAIFGSLTEQQTTALLAACKREKVTITSALFAAMSLAIAEKEIRATHAKFPLMLYSYTLLDLRKLSRNFINPIRLGLHISSIFSIATVHGAFSDESFWKLCRKYHVDKNRSFMMLEPWRNLLLQWLLAHAAVFISICNFYRGGGAKVIRWLGKTLPSLSPTFAISNMGSLDHFQWTESGAQATGSKLPKTPMVKEVYGAANIPVSWPFCLLLTSSVNNSLKLNFAFSPQALLPREVESLSHRVQELLCAVATPPAETPKG